MLSQRAYAASALVVVASALLMHVVGGGPLQLVAGLTLAAAAIVAMAMAVASLHGIDRD